MHDLIGSAGMLRGWTAMWTMQMLWLFAALVMTVGAIAMIEVITTGWREVARVRHVPGVAPPRMR